MGQVEDHLEKTLTPGPSSERRELMLEQSVSAISEEIGRWSAVLTEGRARTLNGIATISPEEIDWQPPLGGNTIGTLLYHIALIEADWLFAEILEQPLPEDLRLLFRLRDREAGGALVHLLEPVGQHVYRLGVVRELLLGCLGEMTLPEFRRVRSLRDYDVTPEWVVIHLLQHEAEHRGQIAMLRRAFRDSKGQS